MKRQNRELLCKLDRDVPGEIAQLRQLRQENSQVKDGFILYVIDCYSYQVTTTCTLKYLYMYFAIASYNKDEGLYILVTG